MIEIKKKNIITHSRQIGKSIKVGYWEKFALDNDLVKTCKKCDSTFYLLVGEVWPKNGCCPRCVEDNEKKDLPPAIEKKEKCQRCKGRGIVLKGTGKMRRTEEWDGPSVCERSWEVEITVLVACPDCRPEQFAFDKKTLEDGFRRYKLTDADYC